MVVMDRPDFRVLRDWAEPGAVRRMHNHADATYHVFTLLTGQLTLTIEGQPPVDVKAGDVSSLKGGAMHTFKNTGTVTATIVEVFGKAPARGRSPSRLELLRRRADELDQVALDARSRPHLFVDRLERRSVDDAHRDVVGEPLGLHIRLVRVDPHVPKLVRNRGFDFVVTQLADEIAIDGDHKRPGAAGERFDGHHQRIVIDERDVHAFADLEAVREDRQSDPAAPTLVVSAPGAVDRPTSSATASRAQR